MNTRLFIIVQIEMKDSSETLNTNRESPWQQLKNYWHISWRDAT